jgi:hypothetical protein
MQNTTLKKTKKKVVGGLTQDQKENLWLGIGALCGYHFCCVKAYIKENPKEADATQQIFWNEPSWIYLCSDHAKTVAEFNLTKYDVIDWAARHHKLPQSLDVDHNDIDVMAAEILKEENPQEWHWLKISRTVK